MSAVYKVAWRGLRLANEEEKPKEPAFVGHVKAADYFIGVAWKWVMMAIAIVGFGFSIGVSWRGQATMEKSFGDFKNEVRIQLQGLSGQVFANVGDVKKVEADQRAQERETALAREETRALRERIQNLEVRVGVVAAQTKK